MMRTTSVFRVNDDDQWYAESICAISGGGEARLPKRRQTQHVYFRCGGELEIVQSCKMKRQAIGYGSLFYRIA